MIHWLKIIKKGYHLKAIVEISGKPDKILKGFYNNRILHALLLKYGDFRKRDNSISIRDLNRE